MAFLRKLHPGQGRRSSRAHLLGELARKVAKGSLPTVTDSPHARPERGAERSSQGRMSGAGANADVPSVSLGGQGIARIGSLMGSGN